MYQKSETKRNQEQSKMYKVHFKALKGTVPYMYRRYTFKKIDFYYFLVFQLVSQHPSQIIIHKHSSWIHDVSHLFKIIKHWINWF